MTRERQILIGELARRTGLAVSALRYYEQIGVLSSVGRSAGQRMFDEGAVVRVRAVMLAQRAGFGLAEIRGLLGEHRSEQDFEDLVRTKLNDVRRRKAELDAAERMLMASLRAGTCDLDVCAFAMEAAPDDAGPDLRMF